MFGWRQKKMIADREEEVRQERGRLAEKIVELERTRSHVEEMVKNALDLVQKANHRAAPPHH